VLTAAFELSVRDGVTPTIEEIAKRSGVQKTSIYRRWGTIEGVVLDAVQDRLQLEIPIPDTGFWRDDLLIFIREAIAFHRSPLGTMLTRMAVDAPDEFRGPYWRARFGHAAAILERGQARGEVSAEIDGRLVIELLTGPLYLRSLITGEPLEPELAERLLAVLDRTLAADKPRGD
jgi:AcrR family transcriptional regulator